MLAAAGAGSRRVPWRPPAERCSTRPCRFDCCGGRDPRGNTVSVSRSIRPFEGALDHGSTRRDGTGQGSRAADHQVSLLDLHQRGGAVRTDRLLRGVRARAGSRPRRRPPPSRRPRTRSSSTRLPTIPTKDYEPIVDEKTEVLTKDVNTAWKTLYDRQAPLLTWPETVQERFQKWGRKWPEDVDAGKVTSGPGRLHRGLQRLRRYGLQDLQAVRLRDGRRNRGRSPEGSPAPPRRVFRRTGARPRQDLVGPGAALDSAHAAWRSSRR